MHQKWVLLIRFLSTNTLIYLLTKLWFLSPFRMLISITKHSFITLMLLISTEIIFGFRNCFMPVLHFASYQGRHRQWIQDNFARLPSNFYTMLPHFKGRPQSGISFSPSISFCIDALSLLIFQFMRRPFYLNYSPFLLQRKSFFINNWTFFMDRMTEQLWYEVI